MCDLPRPGMEPMSSALAGRFFTTELPGNPQIVYFLNACIWNLRKWCALNYVSCSSHPTLCFSALATLLCGTSGSLPVTAVCLPTFCLPSGSCLIHCFSLSNPSRGKQALKSILIHTTSLYGQMNIFLPPKGSISKHLRSGPNNLNTIKLLCTEVIYWKERRQWFSYFWLHQTLQEDTEDTDRSWPHACTTPPLQVHLSILPNPSSSPGCETEQDPRFLFAGIRFYSASHDLPLSSKEQVQAGVNQGREALASVGQDPMLSFWFRKEGDLG